MAGSSALVARHGGAVAEEAAASDYALLVDARLEALEAASRAMHDVEREQRTRYRLPRLDDTPEQKQQHEADVAAICAAHAAEGAAHEAVWELARSGAVPFEVVRTRYCASIRAQKQRGAYYGGRPMGSCRPEEIRT